MAKARKTSRKTTGRSRKAAAGTRKAAGRKTARKKTARKRPSKGPSNKLDLTPLKKQIRDHVRRLSAAETIDPRVADALSTLRRAHSELLSACGESMILALN